MLAFGRYQAGRSRPALIHLPTKVPSGICSASQTMISCVEVIQINTGMELKFRDWNRWRQPLFRREAAARAHHDLTNPPRNGGRPWAGAGGGPANLIPRQGVWDRKI